METTEITPFTTLHDQLDLLDELAADGPTDGEAPEAFLKRMKDQALAVVNAITQITPEDVNDEYFEEEV